MSAPVMATPAIGIYFFISPFAASAASTPACVNAFAAPSASPCIKSHTALTTLYKVLKMATTGFTNETIPTSTFLIIAKAYKAS